MPLGQTLYCGPAGWSYAHWNGVVYPKAKPRGFHSLELIARYFDVVEINTTFYQAIRPEIARLWIKKVEANSRFVFTAKLHRRFTHDRILDPAEVTTFKEGLWPLARARKLGAVLMQFPWSFRYTEENREFLIRLRRAFHEFPLVAEMRHSSWMREEALGLLIDYRVGFCNIDQAAYTKAMPPTSFLTSEIGYIRLHGRNPQDWEQEFARAERPAARHDYLYSKAELSEWGERIEHVRQHAARTFVISNNDAGGKAVVNALELSAMFGDERRRAPIDLLRKYPLELSEFHPERPLQPALFGDFGRAVA
jgi:uncharacterized protein YecE (DUF72 family)